MYHITFNFIFILASVFITQNKNVLKLTEFSANAKQMKQYHVLPLQVNSLGTSFLVGESTFHWITPGKNRRTMH